MPPPADRSPLFPSFWQAALLCTVYVGAQIAFSLILAVASTLTDLPLVTHPLSLSAVSVAAFATTLALAWLLARPPLLSIWRLHPQPIKLLLPVVITTLGTVILYSEIDNLVRTVLPIPDWMEGAMEGFTEAAEHPWSGAVLLVLVAPITEELLFRGLILRGLLSHLGRTTAILLSTLLFTLVHLNPWQFAGAAGLGLLAGWLYSRTRSVVPGLLAHGIQNLAVCLVPWLPFHIDGFTATDLFEPPAHQPMWFTTLGLLLVAMGIGLILRSQPSSAVDTPEPPQAAPPPPATDNATEAPPRRDFSTSPPPNHSDSLNR